MITNWREFDEQQSRLGQVAVIQTKSSRKKINALKLPVIIGRSPICDIVLNSDAFADVNHVLYSVDGVDLKLKNLINGKEEPLNSLKSLDLYFSPLLSTERSLSMATLFLARLAQAERQASQCLPGLKKLSRQYRTLLYATSLLVGVFFCVRRPAQDSALHLDRFATPVPLAYERLFSFSIESSPKFRDYRRGVQFSIPMPKENHVSNSRLSFDITDLNEVNEFEIVFNDQHVAMIGYEAQCIVTFCNLSFLLPSGWWRTGDNQLMFKHNDLASNFIIQNVLLQPVTPAKEVDRLRVTDRLHAAERLFTERTIAKINLVTALQETKKIISFTHAFSDLQEIGNMALVLQEKVSKEMIKARADLSFEADRHIALGDWPAALAQLRELKELYTADESQDRLRIEEQINRLNRRSF